MLMNVHQNLIPRFNREVVKLVISLVVLLMVRLLLSPVTVLETSKFFSTSLSFLDCINVLIDGVMMVFFLGFAFHVKNNFELVRFPSAMNILKWAILLSGAIIAYAIYQPVAYILFEGNLKTFNLIFLTVTVLLLIRLLYLLFINMERVVDLFTGRIRLVLTEPIANDVQEGNEGGQSSCPFCGCSVKPGARFCPNDGKLLPEARANQAADVGKCSNPECRQPILDNAKFCKCCGTTIVRAPGRPSAPAGLQCAKCGVVLAKNAKFCRQCGSSVGGS
jgi:hypothetical protein